MNKTRLFILPGVAAVLVCACLGIIARDAFGAQIVGPDASWARSILLHAPGPAGPPITVEVGPTYVQGRVAGGGWSGWSSTIKVADRRDVVSYAHELGHAFDERNLDDVERYTLNLAMGFDYDVPWKNPARWIDGDPFCERLACPNERFADFYSYCALGLKRRGQSSDGEILLMADDGNKWTYISRSEALVYKRVCRLISTFRAPPDHP